MQKLAFMTGALVVVTMMLFIPIIPSHIAKASSCSASASHKAASNSNSVSSSGSCSSSSGANSVATYVLSVGKKSGFASISVSSRSSSACTGTTSCSSP